MRLYQVRIVTDDFKRAFSFYAETLGMNLAWGDVDGPYAAFALDGQANLAIFDRAGMKEALPDLATPPPSAASDSSPMVVLQVDNVDRLFEAFTRKGCQFENHPRDYPNWTIRAVHLRDPDGVLIEFFEPLPEDRWTPWARDKNAQALGNATPTE